jgi:hypothetical protein
MSVKNGTPNVGDITLRVLIEIDIITLLMLCSSQKRLQSDLRAAVQQQTAQWLP